MVVRPLLSSHSIHVAERVLDLCRENGVDAYPQMNLYKDGKFVKTFDEVRSPTLLHSFLSAHAAPTGTPAAPQDTAVSPPEPSETHVAYAKLLPAVSDRPINPTGTVLSLGEKTFYDAISHGHIFIKFFAPWYVAYFPSFSFIHPDSTYIMQVRTLQEACTKLDRARSSYER